MAIRAVLFDWEGTLARQDLLARRRAHRGNRRLRFPGPPAALW